MAARGENVDDVLARATDDNVKRLAANPLYTVYVLILYRNDEMTIDGVGENHATKSVPPSNETSSEDARNSRRSDQSDKFQVRLNILISSMFIMMSIADG